MTAENITLFENAMPLYNRLMATPSLKEILESGILDLIQDAFTPSLKDIVRAEFSPLYDYNAEDTGAAHQMILFAFDRFRKRNANVYRPNIPQYPNGLPQIIDINDPRNKRWF
jgi:hypothetical protein